MEFKYNLKGFGIYFDGCEYWAIKGEVKLHSEYLTTLNNQIDIWRAM
jgi:hypothetical protein